MNREWAESRLGAFVELLSRYQNQHRGGGQGAPSEDEVFEQLSLIEPIIRAVRPDLVLAIGRRGYTFTFDHVREQAIRALGTVRAQAELEANLGPIGPQLAASGLHPWVWETAASLWDTGHRRSAVQAAATSVDVHLQAKLDRRKPTGTALAREAFTTEPAAGGRPRLRFAGDRNTDTWRSRQAGARDFAAGCFEAVRNPASHNLDEPSEQEALEHLAALSLLARWIDECEVVTSD